MLPSLLLGLAAPLRSAAWAPVRAARRALSRAAADPALATSFPRGLTGAGATDRHYTGALDLAEPLLLRGSGDFLAAARADARERAGLRGGSARLSRAAAAEADASVREHVRGAAAKCREFVLSGRVHGRAELKGALEALCRGEGALGLLLGGKSVGKSLLLSELARRTDLADAGSKQRAVLYVDARRCGTDLCSGLAGALEEEAREQQLAGPRRTQDECKGSSPHDTHAPPPSSLKAALKGDLFWGAAGEGEATLGAAASPAQRNRLALARTLELVQAKGMYLCLIVDEVNLALALPPPSPAGQLQQQQQQQSPQQHAALQDARLLLEMLVALTKQSNAANVLLVSSEYAFPYRLQHDNFFNASNLTHVIFAGEVPPAEMRALLRDSWGLGPRLSDVFLAYYGGHVHMAARALAALAEEGVSEFNSAAVAPVLAAHQIDACLEASRDTVAPLLQQLAQRGFARVEGAAAQAAAQLLARANVAGLVDANAKVLGLSPHVRSGAKYGLVPSSHFMRHLVAKALHEWKPPC